MPMFFLVFAVLTTEEVFPLFGASTQYDIFDIIANGVGALLAILTFEIIKLNKKLKIK